MNEGLLQEQAGDPSYREAKGGDVQPGS